MPLTPRFALRQTSTHVYVEIQIPSFRLSVENCDDSNDGFGGGMEVALTGGGDDDDDERKNSEFHFYAKPYLLKLNFFPHQFENDDDDDEEAAAAASNNKGGKEIETAKYDPSKQTVVIPLRKKQVAIKANDDNDDDGNHWPDLELTARLMEPKEIPKKWLHAVVDSSSAKDDTAEEEDNKDLDSSKYSPSSVTATTKNLLLLPEHENNCSCDGYGFDLMYHNLFTDYCRSGLTDEMLPQLEGLDPDSSTLEQRRMQRRTKEEQDFDFDRYFNDLDLSQDDYMYPMVMEYQPWWKTSGSNDSLSSSPTPKSKTSELSTNQKKELSPPSIFTDDEKLLLSTIPYPLLPSSSSSSSSSSTNVEKKNYELWCGLLDIVLPYGYDHIMTMGEPTVESAWTISTLSTGLSCLECPTKTTTVESVLNNFLRRIVIYPYWRNIECFGLYIIREIIDLFKVHGIRGVTKCLLQTRIVLEKSESYYMGNKLFVDPYLYWIQNLNSSSDASSLLDRMVIEMETCLMSPPDTDNALVTEVQNSLGIDVLMDEFFHTDSETGDYSVTTSAGSISSSDEEENDDNDNDTDTTTEIELEEIDDNDDEDNGIGDDKDEDVKDATAAIASVSIRTDDDDNNLGGSTGDTTFTSNKASSSAAASTTTSNILLNYEEDDRSNHNGETTLSTSAATKPLITEIE